MSSNTVDWTTLASDPASASSVAALEALAASFDPRVPAVLVPVRVETRFTTVEVPDLTDHLGELLDHLRDLEALLERLADAPYATVLTGPVRRQKKIKNTVEARLYKRTETDLDALGTALETLRFTLEQPITSATPQQTKSLHAAVEKLRASAEAVRPALTAMRSDYQRSRFVAAFEVQRATLDDRLAIIEKRVQPGLRLVADLDIRPGARAARELGRTPDGRLVRADLIPGSRATRAVAAPPPTRVVLDDGTSPEALGAARVARLESAQLVAAAEAADLILNRLDNPTAVLDDELRAAAAGIVFLPGALKADLLAKLDKAARRRGATELRAEIAATPSDRLDLDALVPERSRDTVWTLPGPTKTVHQLLVRIYPEPLAVDTHEEELTETERTGGANFWIETAVAGADDELRKGAWRALCVGRTTRRAAWIARATEPVDAGPTDGAHDATLITEAISVVEKRLAELDSDRPSLDPGVRPRRSPLRPAEKELSDRQIAGVVRALKALDERVDATRALPAAASTKITARLRSVQATVKGLDDVFTNVPVQWSKLLNQVASTIAELPEEPRTDPSRPPLRTRSGTWTRAASSTVLPTRFAVVTIADGQACDVAAGHAIPSDLALGIDPGGDTFSLDEDGGLNVPDSIRWMTDFDEAVAKGMALRMSITAQQAEDGFDELLVLGLSDGDADDGTARLTAMLEAHHYTGAGLSMLPTGTPTNNTEEAPAGLSSRDDVDEAFSVERGGDLVHAVADSDGLRLATALGVDADVFAHVGGADGTDARDSLVANAALYPGTIGHALEELASGLISRDARARLQTYALGDVAARGLLPALRVDDQPYGLLPAVALSRLRPDVRDAGLESASPSQRAAQQQFDVTLVDLLRHLHEDWSTLRVGPEGGPSVKHVHSPEVGEAGFDAQQHFLAMLGLEPSSVGASYRFSVNVADRAGVRGEPDLGLSFGIPPLDGSTGDTAAAFGPFALMEHLADVFRGAFGLPAGPPRDPDTGLVSDDWAPVYDLLVTSRAYGLRLLTGLWPLQGVVSVPATTGSASTGSWILALLGRTLEDLRERTEQDLSNVGLAEMFARQALLAQARHAAAEILIERGLLSPEALAIIGTSSLYQTWSSGTLSRTSAWGLLFGEVDHVVDVGGTGAAVPGDLANRTMSTVIQANRPAAVDAHRAAVTSFANLSADRMDALTREHLDLASHRLDAWIAGLAHRRLRTMREVRRTGAHVGAYGWVENLRPKASPLAATGVPPSLAGLPGRPLTRDPSGEGFILTPSPSHAVTAAILRAAYRSQTAEGSFGNEMSVNLSSNRVRVALSLIDGVRAGNDLGALLGYRLERFLHEYYARPDTPAVVELDSSIFPLRRAYPTVAAVDPGADAADPAAGAVTEPTRYVVDGLALVRTILEWIEANDPDATGTLFDTLMARLGGHPWGTTPGALPTLSDMNELTGVLRGIDSIADALDALGDLTTSETVHQLVRGNHVRAAAVLAALSEGKAIPHPEVTDTPRTGLPVSHKLLLQLPAVAADPVSAPAGWDAVAMTPRAVLEPSVNAWVAELLGDPALIRVRLAADQLAPDAALPEASIADLGLQPLDLVTLLADGFDSAVGTLTARVLDLRQPTDLPPDQPGVVVSDGLESSARDAWSIESRRAPAWGPSIRSITDVAPLLEACVDLLGRAKAARATDLASPEAIAVAGDGIDLDDLATRVQRLLNGARSDAVTLARLLAEDAVLDAAVLDDDPAVWLGGLRTRLPDDVAAEHPSAWLPALDLATGSTADVAAALARLDEFWQARVAWRTAAKAAQTYGIRVGLPRRFLSRVQVSTELVQSAEVAFLDLATRCRDAAIVLDGVAEPTASMWTDAARVLLGEGVTIVPKIGLDPIRNDLQTALDAHLVRADEVDAWLEGAAAVRPGAADLADLQVLAEAIGRTATTASVAQLPHVSGDPWLGGAVADTTTMTGKVSVVIFGAEHLPTAGESGTSLLVDEWSESVPFREEMSGVALHYDQPDATAPQAILVAVPPSLDAPWTLTDFAATLHDTLELGRNRTVELEHIGAGRYGQLLPLLVGEVVPHAAGTDVAGDRVILDFDQNNP